MWKFSVGKFQNISKEKMTLTWSLGYGHIITSLQRKIIDVQVLSLPSLMYYICKISRKTNITYPLIRTRTYAYQEVIMLFFRNNLRMYYMNYPFLLLQSICGYYYRDEVHFNCIFEILN